jgi:hypothetical protein
MLVVQCCIREPLSVAIVDGAERAPRGATHHARTAATELFVEHVALEEVQKL